MKIVIAGAGAIGGYIGARLVRAAVPDVEVVLFARGPHLRAMEERGLRVTGASPDGKFVEMVELEGHPWFVGCQFHPEYKSRPSAPHPLFRSFVAAARAYKASMKTTVQMPQPREAEEMV